MPLEGVSSDDRGGSRRPRDSSRSRSRAARSRSRGSASPVRRHADKEEAPKSLEATFEIVDGVPKEGDPTWRAEVNLPRPARGQFADAKPSFITIRGPSRLDKKDADEDGHQLVDAARDGGMEACRRKQKLLNNSRLEKDRAKSRSRSR